MAEDGIFHSISVSVKEHRMISNVKTPVYGFRIRYYKTDPVTKKKASKTVKMWRLKRIGARGKTELEEILPTLDEVGRKEGMKALLQSIGGKLKNSKLSKYPNVSKTKNDMWEASRFEVKGKRVSGDTFSNEDHAGVTTAVQLHRRNSLLKHVKPGSPLLKLLNASGIWTQAFWDVPGAAHAVGDVVSYGDDYPIATIAALQDNGEVLVTVFTMWGDADGQSIINISFADPVKPDKLDPICFLPLVTFVEDGVQMIGFFNGFDTIYKEDEPDNEIAQVVILKEHAESGFEFLTVNVAPLTLKFKGAIDAQRLGLHAEALIQQDWSRLVQ